MSRKETRETKVVENRWEVTPSQAPLVEEAEAALKEDAAYADTAPVVKPAARKAAVSAAPPPPITPREAAIVASLRNSHPAHVDHGGATVMSDLGHRAVIACKCGELLHAKYRDPRPDEAV